MPAPPPLPPPPVSSTGPERDKAEQQFRARQKDRYSFEDTILAPGSKRTLG